MEYKFVSLYLSEQQSRTEQIQWTPLICPSLTPQGGMGGLDREGGGSKGALKEDSGMIQSCMASVSDWIMN